MTVDDPADRLAEAVRSGDPDQLGAVIDALRADAENSVGFRRAVHLSIVGIALHTRYSWTGDRTDIDAAVDTARQALATCPEDHPERVAMVANLGNVLRIRFEAAATASDLDEAISLGLRADADGVPDPARHAVILNNLSLCLRIRYQAAGDRPDIDAAIAVGRRAVDVMPADFGSPDALLGNLAGAYQAAFERSGDADLLDQAIDAGRRAIQAGGPGSPHRPSILSNLCGALQIRAERTGRGDDFDEAVDAGRAAVQATPPGHVDLGGRLVNLCAAYLVRHDRLGDDADLDAAVAAARESVQVTNANDPALAGRQTNLAAALRTRAVHTRDAEDLAEATTVAAAAVDRVAVGHPGRPAYLSNLGACLREVFRRTADPAHAAAAADVLRQAVAASDTRDPNLTLLLSNLGGVLSDAYALSADANQIAEAILVYRAAAAAETGRPSVRVAAAAAWGRLAAQAGDWPDALDGLTQAVDLLARVAPRQLADEDQQHELARHAAIASDAAACAVQLGRPELALALLEQGRGLLLSQAIDARADLAELQDAAPHLAQRFDGLRRALDAPVSDPAGRSTTATYDDRARLAAEFGTVVAEIRRVDGFGDFLRRPAVEELLPLAAFGAIIAVNVSTLRSDALIVSSTGVRPVELPMATPEAVHTQFSSLAAGADQEAPTDEALTPVLDWLWRAVVAPLVPPPPGAERRTRWWWMPTGLLSLLPLHAARTADGGDCLLDRVVSSYAPTLRSLRHARTGKTVLPQRVLALAAPGSGGAVLPGTTRELAAVERALGVPVTVVADRCVDRAELLDAVQSHPWVHAACHAVTGVLPSGSALEFHDTQGDPLRLADVARLRVADATVAYLSACSTARAASDLSDEVLHIASAFQIAGYSAVIGTLWPVRDAIAVRVAKGFYSHVAGTPMAEALHSAAEELYRLMPDHPTAWAAYVHVGA